MCNCRCRKCCDNSNCQDMCNKCTMNRYRYITDENNDRDNDACKCGFTEEKKPSVFPEDPMLAQSYVPIQTLGKTFIPSVGLKMGTIYPELVMPYKPCQSLEDIAFIKAMNTVKEGCNKC